VKTKYSMYALLLLVSLIIVGCPPVVTITAPGDGSTYETDQSITFQGTGTDLDGSTLSYSWIFGDGETATGETTTHSYDTAGTYTATLTVTDGSGVSGTASISLTITSSLVDNGPLSLSQIKFFAYQIQKVEEDGAADVLASTHYDMLVLEPTRTDWSSDSKNFDTKAMVTKLKNTKASDNTHRKLLIAYIDIGQAEDWRWYWTWSADYDDCNDPFPNDWPDYIIACDPDGWAGNYPVAYWEEEWKDIVIYGVNQDSSPYGDYTSIIDEVIKDGFDGIYLDWVEAFEMEAVMDEAQKQGKDPAVEMINFIQEMRDYAEKRNPDFIIIQQNAASLIDGRSDDLLSVIDAIAQEAIWYDGDATDNWDDTNGYDFLNDSSLVDYYLGYLDQYLSGGVPVFDVEYALNYEEDAYSKAYNKGYVPYCTRRSLAKLTTTPPPDY
jgi:cysteinyl-tRNA synthetase